MKKRFLLILFGLLTAVTATAYDFVSNGIYYTIYGDDGFVEVTFKDEDVNSYSGSVTIPSSVTHNGTVYQVGAIANYAFLESSGLTSVTIPNTVEYIGESAFESCDALTSVTIPNSVEYIDEEAFNYCDGLESVIIGSGCTGMGQSVFNHCNSLSSITCYATTPPEIYSNTFTSAHFNYSLLTVPKGCKSAYQAADWWKNFTSIYEIPYDFEENGIYYAITGSNTVEVTFSDAGGGSYSGSVVIPSTVTYSGTTYRVSAIGHDAFYFCYQVISVSIPNTVTSIGDFAFAYSPNIDDLTIPSSVTYIGLGAFDETCFYSVTCLAATPPMMASYVFDNYTYSNTLLFVPRQSLNAYKSANCWKNFTSIHAHLDYALNTGYGAIEFNSTGNYPWTNVVEGDRVYAMSGNKGVHSSTSSLTATVTVGGNGTVFFDFKAWGEGSSWDVCRFLIDGETKFTYGNRDNDWESCYFGVSPGTHTLEWRYTKDSSVNPTGDFFAVDNVKVMGGDVNGDGELNIADVCCIIDALLTGGNLEYCDINCDGSANITDVTYLIDILLNGNGLWY